MTDIRRFADLAAQILAAPARLGPVRWVAVDGRAGSGKTTFAGRLSAALRAAGVRVAVLHTDDLLQGWTDIESYWPRLRDDVLAPFEAGRDGAYRRYNWHTERFEDEWTPVPRPEVLVLEGVASARASTRPLLTYSAYLVADSQLRLARGIARDGEALRGHWLRWMGQEDRYFPVDGAEQSVDERIDGAPAVPHDSATEYVLAARLAEPEPLGSQAQASPPSG